MNTEYFYPVTFSQPTQQNYIFEPTFDEVSMPKAADDGSVNGLNLSYFLSDDARIEGKAENVEAEMERKKRKQTKGKPINVNSMPNNNSTQIQSDTSAAYADSYKTTNAILETAIAQSDQLLNEIKQDIDAIRASKTLKGKYTYLTNLTSSAASLINTRITAAREINSSITQSHNLELKRAKDIKDMARDDKNDDARMMDLYNAFINNPIGMYDNKLNMPTIPAMMLGANDPNSPVSGVSMNGDHESNITPEQLRMRMENNPNIEEIIRYDASSGRRWFEVIDKMTGAPIPNYPTSDPFLLEDISIDVRAGTGRNRNLDRVWNVQTIGNLSEY